MKLRLAPWLVCVLLLAVPPSALGQGSVRTRYTLRLEDLELARHRLVVELPGVRFVYLEELLGLDSLERRLGVALPAVVAGPLAPAGLWKKVFNPLGHGPASTAHEEAAALRLDASLEASSRRGVVVLAGATGRTALRGGLAVMRTSRVPLQGGGWLTWGAPEGGAAEALAVYSLPPADRPQDGWYLPEAPYPGGGLLHLAARLAACGAAADGFGTATPGRVALSWAAALSGGPLVRSGACSELLVRGEGEGHALALLGGVFSPDYRSPDGKLGDRALHGAVRLELDGRTRSDGTIRSPVRWSLESELETASRHRRAAPQCGESVAANELRGSAGAALEGTTLGGVLLRGGAEGEGRLRRLSGGALDTEGSVLVSVRAETDRARLEAEVGWRGGTRDGSRVSVEVLGAHECGRGENSLRLRGNLSESAAAPVRSGPWLLGGSLRYTAEREGWSLFLDLHTREDLRGGSGSGGQVPPPSDVLLEIVDVLGVTLGWDVRVRR